jgi:spermidine/putrescine transport system permease protein
VRTRNYGPLYSLPIGLWFTAFFLVPLAIIVAYSFLQAKTAGGVIFSFSADAWLRVFSPGVLRVSLNTILVSLVSCILTLVVALPCGYYMARAKNKTGFLILVIIPFWTNFIIRIIAWKRILDGNGLINSFLQSLGLIDEPLPLFGNYFAIILINVYMYLPYAILPLYSTMEKFDFTLLEAARDLGATKPQSMFKILLPNIRGGIVTAIFFTFIPLLGSFVVQQIAGNKDMYMLGNLITDAMKLGNYPFASGLAVVIMLLTGAGIVFFLKGGAKNAQVKVRESAADQGITVGPLKLKPKSAGAKK